MRRLALAAALIASTASLAAAATDDELRQQIVGAWGADDGCAKASLVFNADGTFAMVEADRDPAAQRGGTWTITDGVLNGHTTEGDMPAVTVRVEDTKLYFEEQGQVVNELTRCAS